MLRVIGTVADRVDLRVTAHVLQHLAHPDRTPYRTTVDLDIIHDQTIEQTRRDERPIHPLRHDRVSSEIASRLEVVRDEIHTSV